MPFSSTFEDDLLKLIFQAVAISNIADNAAGSPLTSFYVSLHTADPSAGNQTTSEATYTSYARVAVTRDSSGFTVATNALNNAGTIAFPAATGGSNSISHFGIGTSLSGAGKLLASGALSGNLSVSSGVTPTFTPGSLTGTLV